MSVPPLGGVRRSLDPGTVARSARPIPDGRDWPASIKECWVPHPSGSHVLWNLVKGYTDWTLAQGFLIPPPAGP